MTPDYTAGQAAILYSKYKYLWEQLDNTMDSLYAFIQHHPFIHMDSVGNITVCNTLDVQSYPVFCCHLDTVHQKEPDLELINDDVLVSFDGGGVGGDDKCGIVACLEMLDSGIPCKAIFFRDEERGCKGSQEYCVKSLKDDIFCIEIDRRGANDLIFSASRGQMCNEEFQERVKKAFPHGVAATGSLTDVCVLGDAGINMMNLSAGYYRPHTDKEYVVLSQLQRNIECLKVLTKDLMEHPINNKYTRSNVYAYTTKTWQGYSKSSEANNGRGGQDSLFKGTDDSAGADDYNLCQYGRSWSVGNDDPSDIPFSARPWTKKKK